MTTIFDWMLENKIAENGFSASHIYKGLRLNEVEFEEQKTRCILYRKWRSKTEKKESKRVPSWQAYELTLHGIDPEDVELRQAEMEIK